MCEKYDIKLSDTRALWLIALSFWAIASVASCWLYPVTQSDVISRYAPMAEAFAIGDWNAAFHPRFGVFFQMLSGAIVWVSGLDGSNAVQIAALGMLALAIIPLWRLTAKLFGRDIAWWTIALMLVTDRFWSNAIDGLRDPIKLLAFALLGNGIVNRKPLQYALGLFLIATSFAYGFVVALVALVFWLAYDWRRLCLPLVAFVLGTLSVSLMVYHFTGWFVPAPHFIKYLGAIL